MSATSVEWGDVTGNSRMKMRQVAALHQAIDRHCSRRTTLQQFLRLAADVPLVIAPAQFIWTTFERASSPNAAEAPLSRPPAVIAPSCRALCAAMIMRGHDEFNEHVKAPADGSPDAAFAQLSGGTTAASTTERHGNTLHPHQSDFVISPPRPASAPPPLRPVLLKVTSFGSSSDRLAKPSGLGEEELQRRSSFSRTQIPDPNTPRRAAYSEMDDAALLREVEAGLALQAARPAGMSRLQMQHSGSNEFNIANFTGRPL
jgi:hypothetical protein